MVEIIQTYGNHERIELHRSVSFYDLNAYPLFYKNDFIVKYKHHFYSFLYIVNEKVMGVFNGVIEESTFVSQPSSTFGSIYMLTNDELKIQLFYQDVSRYLGSIGVSELLISHYSKCYQFQDDFDWHAFFTKQDTSILYADQTQVLWVGGHNSYQDQLAQIALRKLSKCKQASFQVRINECPILEHTFERIKQSRLRKSYPISTSVEQLNYLYQHLRSYYLFFEVLHQETIIASAIGVKVSDDVLYFYLAEDHEQYLSYSPMVLLLESMYEYAQKNNYRYIDLGISTDKGVLNVGLRTFKINVGGVDEMKYTYRIKL